MAQAKRLEDRGLGGDVETLETYYTAAEAARKLGIGIRAVREACARGEVPSEHAGRAYLIRARDVSDYGRHRKQTKRTEDRP